MTTVRIDYRGMAASRSHRDHPGLFSPVSKKETSTKMCSSSFLGPRLTGSQSKKSLMTAPLNFLSNLIFMLVV